MEDRFFLNTSRGRIYMVHYSPDSAPCLGAVTLASAWAEEHDICRPQLVALGRALARAGFHAARFDYLGTGDSEGHFEDASPTTMCHDMEAVADELFRRSGPCPQTLLGMRIGGTIAALAAARRPDIQGLVLWEPHVDLWDDIYAQLRATVAMQTVLFKEVRFTRDQIVANVLAKKPSESDGYDLNVIYDGFALGSAFLAESKGVKLGESPPPSTTRALILSVRKARSGDIPEPTASARKLHTSWRERGHMNCELGAVAEPSLPWKHDQVYMTHCPALTETTLAWLRAAPLGGAEA